MSDKNNASIAQKIEQLHEMVAWFDSDDFVIEEAVDRFTKAQKLADEIETELREIQNEIVVLKQRFDAE
jgi:exonuclease VII small subunit